MAGKSEETTVGELVRRGILERPLDGNHGSIHPKGNDFVPAGVPFIMASDLIGGGIDTVNCSFITLEQAKSLRKGFAKRGDVLISHKATLGRTALVGEIPGDFVMLTPQVTYYRSKDASRLNNRYLKYYFDSLGFQQVLQSWAGAGSTRAYIGITDQLRLPVLLPAIPTQRAIAHVLGTLDDLIELNRETNEILEEMARALFKSWFVDFDPVRRNKDEGGRMKDENSASSSFIPHPSAFDHLFPDHFQDSELGQIPKGWEVGKVSDLATLGRVAVNPGRHPEEFFDHYSLPAFDDGRSPKTEMGSAIMSNKFLVESDSVLLSKLNPHIPRVWFPDLDTKRRSVCSTEFMVARATAGVSREYLFSLFTDPYFASIYGTLVSGTTGSHQRIGPDSFIAMHVVVPPVLLIKAFTNLVRPMFDTIHSNLCESRDLATLRDTLLPKLLSGEISAPAAKEFLTASP